MKNCEYKKYIFDIMKEKYNKRRCFCEWDKDVIGSGNAIFID